jgi:hypothetical protein
LKLKIISEDDEAKGTLRPELSFNVSFNSASKLNESWNGWGGLKAKGSDL